MITVGFRLRSRTSKDKCERKKEIQRGESLVEAKHKKVTYWRGTDSNHHHKEKKGGLGSTLGFF